MTKKKLTHEEWVARQELKKQFIKEASELFKKYGIKDFKMCDDSYEYDCFLVWKNGLETSLSYLL